MNKEEEWRRYMEGKKGRKERAFKIRNNFPFNFKVILTYSQKVLDYL
jgi:hypothetical protein